MKWCVLNYVCTLLPFESTQCSKCLSELCDLSPKPGPHDLLQNDLELILDPEICILFHRELIPINLVPFIIVIVGKDTKTGTLGTILILMCRQWLIFLW